MSRPGILDSLSPEQQDQLITWIETMPMKAVLERVSTSPPDGFGIKTHITSLHRFYQRHRIQQLQEDLPVLRSSQPGADDLRVYRDAAIAALTQFAYQSATTASANPVQARSAARWLAILRELELRREQLQLARERLEFEHQKLRLVASFKEAECQTQAGVKAITKALEDIIFFEPASAVETRGCRIACI